MFKINEIIIEEFRGIRNLTIKPDGRNFAVCGRNGTGKSGIVDAIEFVLTGNISRLSGEGTSGVTVKKHAPHVDSRDNPINAKVKIKVKVIETGNIFEIERNVENINDPKVIPNNQEGKSIIEYASQHPEFVLSRREIIKFILATAGNRAEQVQILLKLDEIEQIRGELLKISNRNKKLVEALDRKKESNRRDLLTVLDIPSYSEVALLEAVNKRRLELKLAKIPKLTPATLLKDGVGSELIEEQKKRPARNIVLEDILRIQNNLDDLLDTNGIVLINKLFEVAKTLSKNPELSSTFDRGVFLNNALKLIEIDPNSCPVCETLWESQELVQFVKNKLKNFDTTRIELDDFYKELSPLTIKLGDIVPILKSLKLVAIKLDLTTQATELHAIAEKIESFIFIFNKKESLEEIQLKLEAIQDCLKSISGLINIIKIEVEKIPDLSKEVESIQFLIVADERLKNFREAAQEHRIEEQKSKISDSLYTGFLNASESVLKEIYLEVQEDFKNLYVSIHGSDESMFKAELTPGKGKLSFEVDFYGKGFFPPGAYHSEGHQDSMGLCLYLALMKKVTNNSFSLSVLDDVLMSVDSGHRKQVCKMIIENFPDTQFLLTTHDKIWLKNMGSEKLIKKSDSIIFKSWTVDLGPEVNELGEDVFSEIELYLKKDEVNIASSLLRRHLEYISGELCEKLQVPVIYKGERGYDLGDLLPPLISKFRKIIKQCIEAAKLHRDVVKQEELENILKNLDEARVVTDNEYWQINASIHFNNWENLDVNDFRSVAIAFDELIKIFHCDTCLGFYKLALSEGNPTTLLCSCSKNYTLLKPE